MAREVDSRTWNDPEIRDLLHQCWRAIQGKIIGLGVPQGPVVQTMATVAAEEFARIFGPHLAAEYFDAISSAFGKQTARWGELEEIALNELPLLPPRSFLRRVRRPRALHLAGRRRISWARLDGPS